MSQKIKYYHFNSWHFRNNNKRHSKEKNNGNHPTLIVGITNDGQEYLNIGITHSNKRGHHKNPMIKNPINWKKHSHVRDDISLNNVKHFSNKLSEYKLHPSDVKTILKIVEKYKKKNPL